MTGLAPAASRPGAPEAPSSFRIEHQCPQCGAPACLEETDRLYACPYCRVKSLLLTRDVFRYVVPAGTAERDLVHIPYWRFKGMLLFSTAGGNEHKFVDVSRCAARAEWLPQSLGVRPQAMRLRFLDPATVERCVAPAVPLSAAVKEVQRRFAQGLSRPVLYQSHLGESTALIYAPFYARKGRLVDAVLGQPAGRLPEGEDLESLRPEAPGWTPTFMAALCPDCGWDLEGERDALVLLCRNCASAWTPSGDRLTRVDSDCLPDADPSAHYLPFWGIRCEVEGMTLKTAADLARAANLPPPPDPDRDAVFWLPAFKVRPAVYLRMAEALSLTRLPGELRTGLPPADHHPATLPVEEASESLKVVLAGIYKPRRALPEILPAVTLRATHYRLAYLPFRSDAHDFIGPLPGLTVGRAALRLSRNL